MTRVPQLRKGAQKDVWRELDNSLFTAAAFDLEANGPDGLILRISYRDEPEYSFEIHALENGSWRATECPGLYVTSPESSTEPDIGRCRNRINGWIHRLQDDLLRPPPDPMERVRQQFEALLGGMADSTEVLTRNEADNLFEKLDKKVEELAEKLEVQSGEVRRLKDRLAALQKEADKLPKKTVVRSALSRLLGVFGSKMSEEVASETGKALVEGAKRLLE